MKTRLLCTALSLLSLVGWTTSAIAHEDDRNEYQPRSDRSASVRAEVDHLSAMFAHVRAEIRAYGGGRHIRSEFAHLVAERDQLNRQLYRGIDPYRIHSEVQHMHDELHHVEEELHVRAESYYRW